MSKSDIERLWKWIDRPLDEKFFETAGHFGIKELSKRWSEIPEELKSTAKVMIQVAIEKNKKVKPDDDYSCLVYRMMLFDVYNKLKTRGIELFIPHGWMSDGVMIEPEWIVRMTNGLIGVCDAGSNICNMENECRYFKKSKYERGELRCRTKPKNRKK